MFSIRRHIHPGNLILGGILGGLIASGLILAGNTPNVNYQYLTTTDQITTVDAPLPLTPAEQIMADAKKNAHEKLSIAKANAAAAIIVAQEEEDELAVVQTMNMRIEVMKEQEQERRDNHQEVFDTCGLIVQPTDTIVPKCYGGN